MPKLRRAVACSVDFAVVLYQWAYLGTPQVMVSVLVWAVAVALFPLNALVVLLPGRRSLADRVAGTTVTGIGLSTAVATRPVRTS